MSNVFCSSDACLEKSKRSSKRKMSSLRRYGPPPTVVCLDEIKKRLKSFTCSSTSYDFNLLFWILSFTLLSQASLLVWYVHLYALFAKGNPNMRILTLRWVFVRRISYPRDCLSECVPKVVFRQRTTNERKNQFKFNALRRESPIARWGSTKHVERWRRNVASVSRSKCICCVDFIYPLCLWVRSGTTFLPRCGCSLFGEHEVHCFELGMYVRYLYWLHCC